MQAQIVMESEFVAGRARRNFEDEVYADEAGLAFILKSLTGLKHAAPRLRKQSATEMSVAGKTGTLDYPRPNENRNREHSQANLSSTAGDFGACQEIHRGAFTGQPVVRRACTRDTL